MTFELGIGVTNNGKGMVTMKQILLASLMIVACTLVTSADDAYKKFLLLRSDAVEAQSSFYKAVTNGQPNTLGKWREDHMRPVQCVFTPTDGVITNIEYQVSMNAAVTNVHGITYSYRSGIVRNFHYSTDRRLSMIEDCGPARGDFRVYFAGTDGDLESYCTVTNFFAAHGVRHYTKGKMVSEDKGLIDFSVFK